jgi:hypothetical protein
MAELEDQNEIAAYYLHDPPHPRAAAVMWSALIERRIDRLSKLDFDKIRRYEMNCSSQAVHSATTP